jgi:predicted outer membrane repeat protein
MSMIRNLRLLLLAAVLLLGTCNIVFAKQFFVDVNAPGNNDGSSWNDAYTHLQDALFAASKGDEIHVADGIYRPDRGKNVSLGDRAATFRLINGVTIKGGYAGHGESDPNARDSKTYESILSGDLNADDDPNFTYDDENSYHVLTGSGTDESAVLDGFVITGGGMYNKSGSPTIVDCVFKGNFAWCGGAMRNYHSNPQLTDCTFLGNTAFQEGGAIFNFESSPKLTDCTLRENSAKTGGAICNSSNSAGTLGNCVFTGNSARHGAGMANLQDSNPALTECRFVGNLAERGGAMSNRESRPAIHRCTFSDNSASADGGAIHNETGDPVITTCLFNDNSAQDNGGAIYNCKSDPQLISCTFSANSAQTNGGALSSHDDSNAELANCILWDNSDANGTDESAQIYVTDGTTVADYCCIQGWTGLLKGTGTIDTSPKFTDASAGDYHLLPDSPCVNSGDPNFTAAADATDLDGEPRVIKGRLDIGADEYNNIRLVPGEYATIQAAIDAAFNGDIIVVSPGRYTGPGNREIDFHEKAITVRGTDPNIPNVIAETVVDCEKQGRGFYFHSGEDANSVLAGLTVVNGYADNGGAVYCMDGSPTLINCIFGNNWAKYSGGGMCNNNSSPTLTGCLFQKNWAYYAGGGMQNNNTGSPTAVNCTFRGNWAKYSGGGIQNQDGSNPELTDCVFSDNTADNRGGGMHNYRSSPMLTSCSFKANSARTSGGAVHNLGGKPTFEQCTFSQNAAQENGGGLYNMYGSPTLTECVFRANRCKDHGGGMFNGSADVKLVQCAFLDNSALKHGGGIFGRDGSLELTNCVLSGNSAAGNAGAMDNNSSTQMTNCTICGNYAAGQAGAIHQQDHHTYESGLVLTNCILWDNRDGDPNNKGPQVYGDMPIITYSCVQDADPNDELIYKGIGNIDDDPCFISPGRWVERTPGTVPAALQDAEAVFVGGDYHLLPDSPCIDAGDPESDFSREPEPNGGRINMGAYGNTPQAASKRDE